MTEDFDNEDEFGDYSENENDDIEADEPVEAEWSEDDWIVGDDPFINEFLTGAHWEDLEGGYHELQSGEPAVDDAELRQTFETFEEAVDYINEILTGADQYFDIYQDADGFSVYYMGGSE